MLQAVEQRQFDARFSALWSIDPASIVPQRDRHAQSIKDVRVGGVLKLNGEVYVVLKTATCTETNEKYTKDKGWVTTELVLFSLKTGETQYLEWEEDDEIVMSFVERKLTKAELNQRLHDEEGQPFDVDEDIDEACKNKWGIMFEGITYPFDDWWPARYDASDGKSFEAYLYEFGSDQMGWLTIEGWKDGKDWDYEGYLSQTVRPNELEIISLGSQ